LERIESADGPLVLGMIAALFHRSKGVDVALKALAEARRQGASLSLRVLGPGDPAPWLAEAARLNISGAVNFCGVLPRGAPVLSWLDDIDVYVQTSFQEGLPRALIEAMSRAAPALASAAGGTPELVERAALHRPGDAHALARQMVEGLGRDQRRASAKRNFAVATGYAADVLNSRRTQFWRRFHRYAADCGPAAGRGAG